MATVYSNYVLVFFFFSFFHHFYFIFLFAFAFLFIFIFCSYCVDDFQTAIPQVTDSHDTRFKSTSASQLRNMVQHQPAASVSIVFWLVALVFFFFFFFGFFAFSFLPDFLHLNAYVWSHFLYHFGLIIVVVFVVVVVVFIFYLIRTFDYQLQC